MPALTKQEEIQIENTDLRVILDRHIDAIAGSIFGLFFSSGKPVNVSFHDILNRVMLLLQAPITFVLCDDKHSVIYCFNPHPFHKSNIRIALEKSRKNGEFFELFNTKYRLLVLLAADQYIKPSDSNDYKFIPLWKTNYEKKYEILIYKLSRIFDANLYLDRFGPDFLVLLKNVLDDYNEKSEQESNEELNYNSISNEDIDSYYRHYNNYLNQIQNNWSKDESFIHEEYGVIDKVYKKARTGLLLLNNEKDPPLFNFLLFMRSFPRIKDRCKKKTNDGTYAYDYELKIVIGSEQKRDIKKYLEKVKSNIENKHWYLNKNFPKKNERLFQLASDASEDFWNILNEKGGITKLINIARENLGMFAYSMSDPVFKGGIINFRNPSINGGLHRAFNTNENLKDYKSLTQETKNDILRIITIHYLFRGMTNENNKDFRIMLCPIEVAGRILAVIGYATGYTNSFVLQSEFTRNNLIEFSRNWRNCYHTYIDLYTRLKRNVRSYFSQLYIKNVSEVCICSFIEAIESNNFTRIEQLINKRLDFLARFFSYGGYNCHILKNQEHNSAHMLDSCYLQLEEKPSSFPMSPGRKNMGGNVIGVYEIHKRITIDFYYYMNNGCQSTPYKAKD